MRSMRAVIVSLGLCGAAMGQSTAITYQGELKNGGQPVNGVHDLRFTLFNAASGGVQVGATQCADNVVVTNGVFTTTIDFGQQFATPAPRFLQIELRADTGLSCATTTGFTLLSPRQALTAAPISNHAKSAFALDAADGVPGNAVFVDTAGNVGIGTTAPGYLLHVNGGTITASNVGDQAEALVLGIERSWSFKQQGTGATTALKLQSIGGGGNKNFLIETTGFVGIGTLTPQAKLDVNGTARVQVLEITGADLAEKFPASETLEPGTVVAIDRDHSGKLCMSRGAYNSCVAGVVSGANNFSVGAVLGNLPGQEDAPAIALSGRVYVRCDASAGAIEPGDMLTTSDTPGHAMKATDRERAHGAVIGKAMERLNAGERGLILVLVNLH